MDRPSARIRALASIDLVTQAIPAQALTFRHRLTAKFAPFLSRLQPKTDINPSAVSWMIILSSFAAFTSLQIRLIMQHPNNLLIDTLWFILTSPLLLSTLWVTTHFLGRLFLSPADFDRNIRSYQGTVGEWADDRRPPVTIQAVIYNEDFEHVIKPMLLSAVRARERYKSIGGTCNIVTFDDSLQAPGQTDGDLRKAFYRQHDIQVAFVGRPAQPRPGSFKKGGNSNSGYAAAVQLEKTGVQPAISEGDITWAPFAYLLDKDSGMPEKAIEYTLPLMLKNPKLAWVQHESLPINGETFFTWFSTHYAMFNFGMFAPTAAMRGDLMTNEGHNMLLRREALEQCARRRPDGTIQYWDEDQASEDYAFMKRARAAGWEGIFMSTAHTTFSEMVSRSYNEEASRRTRFGFGAINFFLNPIRLWRTEGVWHPIIVDFLKSSVPWYEKLSVLANILHYVGGAIAYLLPLVQVVSILVTGKPSYVATLSMEAYFTQLVITHVIQPLANHIFMARQYYGRRQHRIFEHPLEELRRHFKYDWQSFLFNSSLQGRWVVAMTRHILGIPTHFGATPVGELERLPFGKLVRQIVKDNRDQFRLAAGMLGMIAAASLQIDSGLALKVFLPSVILLLSHIITPFVLNPVLMRKIIAWPRSVLEDLQRWVPVYSWRSAVSMVMLAVTLFSATVTRAVSYPMALPETLDATRHHFYHLDFEELPAPAEAPPENLTWQDTLQRTLAHLQNPTLTDADARAWLKNLHLTLETKGPDWGDHLSFKDRQLLKNLVTDSHIVASPSFAAREQAFFLKQLALYMLGRNYWKLPAASPVRDEILTFLTGLLSYEETVGAPDSLFQRYFPFSESALLTQFVRQEARRVLTEWKALPSEPGLHANAELNRRGNRLDEDPNSPDLVCVYTTIIAAAGGRGTFGNFAATQELLSQTRSGTKRTIPEYLAEAARSLRETPADFIALLRDKARTAGIPEDVLIASWLQRQMSINEGEGGVLLGLQDVWHATTGQSRSLGTFRIPGDVIKTDPRLSETSALLSESGNVDAWILLLKKAIDETETLRAHHATGNPNHQHVYAVLSQWGTSAHPVKHFDELPSLAKYERIGESWRLARFHPTLGSLFEVPEAYRLIVRSSGILDAHAARKIPAEKMLKVAA